MMREIVLDTETTGLDPESGHRLVEIGCVELVNHMPTGEVFHCYINPQRSMPQEAYNVHGLSEDFLKDFDPFPSVVEKFLKFLGEDPLIIHNASFDMKFINYELQKAGYSIIEKNEIVDTLRMARKKFPGSPASLDALCRRFKIDNTARTKHGALIDCELLASVYLELIGGAQTRLTLEKSKDVPITKTAPQKKRHRSPRDFPIAPSELEAHEKFIQKYITS